MPLTPQQYNCNSNALTGNENFKNNLKTDTIRTQIKLRQLAAKTINISVDEIMFSSIICATAFI